MTPEEKVKVWFAVVTFVLLFLTSILTILKLSGVVDWGWWAVLLPLWVPILGLTCVFGAVIVTHAVFEG